MARAWRPGKVWRVAPAFEGAAALARAAGTTALVAQILHNRGVSTPEGVQSFLRPRLSDMHDPSALGGAVAAARRIAQAIRDKQRIVIYGDYDVDGVTAVAILLKCLRKAGGDVHYYVPHRVDEGYGVNAEAVRSILADGTGLIVTVDCGISAVEPVAQAAAAGVDVIVTDHHGLPAELPAAAAIVHPALPEAGYPNRDLSGAGVALKLAWQVAREICGTSKVDEGWSELLIDATCFAALGTIADVVPLVGENRSLAQHGLKGLGASRHPGLRALLDHAGLAGETLESHHVAWVLAPRINACGRMGHARLAVELLMDPPAARAARIVEHLEEQNTERQRVERAITEQAVEMVRAAHLDAPDRKAIVLAADDWHGGVIGIVASRVVAEFSRPAILIALNGTVAHGSGRSIPGFDLRRALEACQEHLVGFGGHAMAGGIRIDPARIGAFTDALLAYAAATLQPEQLEPTLDIDAETTLPALSFPVVTQIARLAPYGQGNPRPVVALRGLQVVSPPRRMGRNGQTVSLVLSQGGATMRAVGFSMGDLADTLAGQSTVDVAAEPTLSSFSGTTTVELKLADAKPSPRR